MDYWTLASSLGISAGTAVWLSRTLVTQWLGKDMERFKVSLGKEMESFKSQLEAVRIADKAALEGQVRELVETRLGDRAAQRQYEFEARKRLYSAIGPLRFQLLLACRDLAGRVQGHGLGRGYELKLGGYYGRSTLFRILRPLCLAELVDRQISYADFSVDAGAVDLLRFKKSAFAAFSGSSLVDGHPDVDWDNQREHVFFDHISRGGNAMIAEVAPGQERAMRFHEFDELLDDRDRAAALSPFPAILSGMTPQSKPLFWVRLVGYGLLCNDFVNRAGRDIGFEQRDYPVAELLRVTKDPTIVANLGEYVQRCQRLLTSPL